MGIEQLLGDASSYLEHGKTRFRKYLVCRPKTIGAAVGIADGLVLAASAVSIGVTFPPALIVGAAFGYAAGNSIYENLRREHMLDELGLDGSEQMSVPDTPLTREGGGVADKIKAKAARLYTALLSHPKAVSTSITLACFSPFIVPSLRILVGLIMHPVPLSLFIPAIGPIYCIEAAGVFTVSLLLHDLFNRHLPQPENISWGLQGTRVVLARITRNKDAELNQLDKLCSLYPDSYHAHLERSKKLFAVGKPKEGYADAMAALQCNLNYSRSPYTSRAYEKRKAMQFIADLYEESHGWDFASTYTAAISLNSLGRQDLAMKLVSEFTGKTRDAQQIWYLSDFLETIGRLDEANEVRKNLLTNSVSYGISFTRLGSTLKPAALISGPLTHEEVVIKGGFASIDDVVEECWVGRQWQDAISYAAGKAPLLKDFSMPLPKGVIDLGAEHPLLGRYIYIMTRVPGEKAASYIPQGLSDSDLEHIAYFSAATSIYMPCIFRTPGLKLVSQRLQFHDKLGECTHIDDKLKETIKQGTDFLFSEDELYSFGDDNHPENFLKSPAGYGRVDTEARHPIQLPFSTASFVGYPPGLPPEDAAKYGRYFEKALELFGNHNPDIQSTQQKNARAVVIKEFSWYIASYEWQRTDGPQFRRGCMDVAYRYVLALDSEPPEINSLIDLIGISRSAA